jgi:exodeoxyribonuclease V alpha subunit
MFNCEENFLDRRIAERILQGNQDEGALRFLSSLVKESRLGHICYKSTEPVSFPLDIICEGKDLHPKAPVVRQKDRYYLQKNWVYETHVLEQVKRLKNQKPSLHEEEIFFHELQQAALLPKQREAIEKTFEESLTLICGGPGTGKTYTAATLVRILCASKKKKRFKVILAAPTGKAASHLHSILGTLDAEVKSFTLHRLLRLSPGKTSLFSGNTIDADLVIVDEASMIDVPLLAQLLESIAFETRLVLMGDPDQLPPVEAGSLFAEMASLFGVRLDKTMRTDQVVLQTLAKSINEGQLSIQSDLRLNWPFDKELAGKLFQEIPSVVYSEKPDPQACLNFLKSFRILGALRQGPFGIDALNRQIISELQKKIHPKQWWAIPIMVTNNDSVRDLYNGSCGVLIGQSKSGEIRLSAGTAYFPEEFFYKDLPPFEIAFCLSIHKSQGSEFDKVIALFPQGSENFGKEALYTAVTRARKELQIIGEESVLQSMVEKQSKKNSGFTERFKENSS